MGVQSTIRYDNYISRRSLELPAYGSLYIDGTFYISFKVVANDYKFNHLC